MGANAGIGIVQRRRLNKLRHVELDVLWIREEQARRLFSLRKVPGPRNLSDMMTKNLDQAQIDMYLDLFNLWFDIGRASIAQNLHLMGEKIAWPSGLDTVEAKRLLKSAAKRQKL